MGFINGGWVEEQNPKHREFPFALAAKLARDSKSLTQDEANQLINEVKWFYDRAKGLSRESRELKRELSIAESTVRLLQVTDT